jgi:hypothetical protein
VSSFVPLCFNQVFTLTAAQVSQHSIDEYGYSPLPCYQDSFFTVRAPAPGKILSPNTERNWIVTRVLVDLPLNEPRILTCEQISALYIKADGISMRPELQRYRFDVVSLGNNKYQITKFDRYSDIVPLCFNQTVTLNAAQFSQHSINKIGESSLPCYADSIFLVLYLGSKKLLSPSDDIYNPKVTYSDPVWTVTRISKSVEDLPLNEPRILTSLEVAALYIRETDGVSDRPELQQYRFELVSLGNGRCQISKFDRSLDPK